MPWVECPLCLSRKEAKNENELWYCCCSKSSLKGELMRPAPWDRYSDEKLWAMFAAHAPVDSILGQNYGNSVERTTLTAARYADELLVLHKQRWEKH